MKRFYSMLKHVYNMTAAHTVSAVVNKAVTLDSVQ